MKFDEILLHTILSVILRKLKVYLFGKNYVINLHFSVLDNFNVWTIFQSHTTKKSLNKRPLESSYSFWVPAYSFLTLAFIELLCSNSTDAQIC